MRTIALVMLLSATILSGCLGTDNEPTDGADAVILPPEPEPEQEAVDRPSTADEPSAPVPLAAGPPLWADPQNTPHPAYGWPTISHPAPNADGFHAPIGQTSVPSTIGGLSHLAHADNVTDGGGLAIYGRLAVLPGYNDGITFIMDISDPDAPFTLSTINPLQGSTHRGATIIAYPDGRIVTAISTSAGFDVWDISDPSQPEPLTAVSPDQGGHKVANVPGTPIVYNAASRGGSFTGYGPNGHLVETASRSTAIYDLSDPLNPVLVQEWENGFSCHHIYFWNDLEQQKLRGLCAGLEYTQIWDMTDPLDPQVIVNVPVPHGRADTPSGSVPLALFSHFAALNQDGTILIVGDETGGGTVPLGCATGDTPSDTSAGTSSPVGALWFYDVQDETDPQLLGWYSAGYDPFVNNVDESCTAHHGRLIPAADGRELMAMSFYGAGVVVVDFSDPAAPHGVAQFAEGSNTWETWYYNGYLFTGDMNRGMDVLAFV